MSKTRLLCALVAMLAMLLTVAAVADEVTGSPLGLRKGEFWLRSVTLHEHGELALWTYEPGEKEFMMHMPEGWSQRVTRSDLRLGYGITDRLDVGLLLTYFDKRLPKEIRKETPNMRWFEGAKQEGRGCGDVWLSAKYEIVKDKRHIDAIALGAGFRFDASDDRDVIMRIGSGAKAFRAVFLSHEHFGKWHFSDDVYYEWQGDRRGIDARNGIGEMIKWDKSGQNIGDQIGYRFNVEYPLDGAATVWGYVSLMGWHKFEDEDRQGVTIDRSDRYEHTIFPQLVWLPQGPVHWHRKIFVGLRCPYSYRKDFEAHVIPVLGMMWTFGGEGS